MNLSKEQIEEQILLFVDAELDEVAAQQLMEYIDQCPEYRAMLDAYLMTQLDDSEHLVFPDKELLLKKETEVAAFIAKPKKMYWAAAAALVITTGLAFYFVSNRNATEIPFTIVKTTPAFSPVAPPVAIGKDSSATAFAATTPSNARPAPVASRKEEQPAVAPKPEQSVASLHDEVTPLLLQQQPAIQEVNLTIAAAEQDYMPQNQVSEEGSTDQLPGWIPVNEENLQGLNDLVARIQALKEDIQERKNKLKNKSFVIHLGQKEIILGNKN